MVEWNPWKPRGIGTRNYRISTKFGVFPKFETRAISKSVWGSLLRVPVTSMDPYGCIIAGNELGQVQGASFCSARSPSLRLASGCNGSSLHGLLRR